MAKRIFRIVRAVLLALAFIVVATAATLYALSERRLDKRYPVAAQPVAARTDSLGIARGAHLYRVLTCAICHAEDGGGAVYEDAGPIGFLAGPNLTSGRGGVAQSRTDLDWVRAIRYGVRLDSTSLIVMPSEVFTRLNDADLGAILGYLRQLPPVDRELAPSHFRWLGRGLLATGRMNILVAPKTHGNIERSTVAEGATREYGRYLADIAGCHGCHGFGLSGGRVAGPPDLPLASNLTPTGLRRWTEQQFFTVMRTGRRPDGTLLHEFMPWRAFRHMSDVELTALWLYLASVPPKAFGGK
ncbi:MAG TPA: cytochrome c [Gemmatimonadaceae bacterium]|nr:cytochrome c [Gemmatimonadaceae bacterium]